MRTRALSELTPMMMSAAILGLAACGGSSTAGGDGAVDGSAPETSTLRDSGRPMDASKQDTSLLVQDTGTPDQQAPADVTSSMDVVTSTDAPTDSPTGADAPISTDGSGKGDGGADAATDGAKETDAAKDTGATGTTCTKDSECAATQICDVATSTCVTSACTAAEQSTACSNPADFCCGGTCAPGNCCVSGDCTTAAAPVCTANVCGKCTTDMECTSNPTFGAGTICDTTSGACVPSTCTAGEQSMACSNPADFCCSLSCIPGNCCTTADCTTAAAPTCGGGGVANVCGKCTADAQCPTGDVCNTTSGACVANTGATDCTGLPPAAGGMPGTCSVSTADMCCTAAAGCIAEPTGTPCCPGTAGNMYCQVQTTMSSAVCDTTAFVCTVCKAESGNTWYVDPVNGSDSGGTGSGENSASAPTPSCSLKTIARALALIGTTGAPTTIVVVGAATAVNLAPTETYPIRIPANVTLTTQTGGVTIEVPAGKAGVVLDAPNSGILGATGAPLTITTKLVTGGGGTTGGTNGIQVGNGSSATTTKISSLTVTGMLDDGIVVTGGGTLIGPGVSSNANGTAANPAGGLHVTDTGTATVSAPLAADAIITFNSNTGHGIVVDSGGSVTISGVVTAAATGTGTVETNKNAVAGLLIEQTPVGGNGKAPANIITGLVSFGTTAGNGMHFYGGSNITLRSSASLGNAGSGVIISTYEGGFGGGQNNVLTNIDLGDSGGIATSNGLNTFQALENQGNNGAAGICLAVAANSGDLLAAGNIFRGINCSTTASALLENPTSCASTVAACGAGGICDLGFAGTASATGNGFTLNMCTK